MSQDFLPDCPPYLNAAEYQYVIQRSNHDCALLEECRRTGRIGQASRCSHLLNFDHIQPRELGGDDGFTNIRLLCESPNKGRPVEPSEYWSKPNFWDRPIKETGLREIQRMAGYDAVMLDPLVHRAVQNYRNSLLQRITLLPGATGIGKAVLTQGVFFAINKVVGLGRPRVRHVLWLTVDRTLRDSTVAELENDLFDYEIINDHPQVRKLAGYEDFLKGSLEFDVCVACPHSLWEVKEGESLRRGPNEIRDALRGFDAIVFDEVDWANDQVQTISQLARHALKFSLTASPPISDAEFVQRCVLISNDAIADYENAVKFDGCLKIISQTEVLRSVANHEGFNYLNAGVLGAQNAKASPDFPVYLAAILHAVKELDSLETSMRRARPDDYYSPHLIVRLPGIVDIEAAYKTLPGCLEGLGFKNPGWNVTAVFQGHRRRLKDLKHDEETLAARNGKKWIHPFMRAKNNRGRADKTSKRILLMCNIGLRGINNWPILYVLDLTGAASMAEDIQFWGRGTRLPDHLRSLHDPTRPDLAQYITVRYCIAETAGFGDKQRQIEEVRDFILNMRQQIIDRQFVTWVDIAEGKAVAGVPPVHVSPGPGPLTLPDRLRLQNQLGFALSQGRALDDGDLDRMVCWPVDGNGQPPSPARVERDKAYIRQLIDNPTFGRGELFGDDEKAHVETVMVKLKPQAVYAPEQLLAFIKEHPDFEASRSIFQERIEDGDDPVIMLISQLLREQQTRLFREPGRTYTLQGSGGVLRTVAGEFCHMLIKQGVLDPKNEGEVYKAVNIAASGLFGIKDASNNGGMDQHAYHVAILGRFRRAIERRAQRCLLRKGLLPGLSGLVNYYERSASAA
jgi:hypothetical protein